MAAARADGSIAPICREGRVASSAANLCETRGIADDPMIPRSSIRPPPRLYILTPAVSDATALSGALAEIFRQVDVAAVLLRLPDAEERSLINRVKAAAGGVQGAGAALLVDGRPDIVARAGADGAHLAGPEALQAAVRTLKPNYIPGPRGLPSPHEALAAAALGAAYVMFCSPATP